MTLRLSALRDTLSLGGYCHGSVESKSRFICGFSQKVNLACGHHTTSNSIKASEPALILLPAHSLAQHPTGCKLSFKPLSLKCVKLISSRKNRRSKLDSLYARIWYIIMVSEKSTNEKSDGAQTPIALGTRVKGGRYTMQYDSTSKPPHEQSRKTIYRALLDAHILNIFEEDGVTFAYEMQEALPMAYEIAEQLRDGLSRYLSDFTPDEVQSMRKEITAEREQKRQAERSAAPAPKDRSGFVYLIRDQNNYKIGISKKPKARISSMQSGSSSSIEVVCYIPTTNMDDLEMNLHLQFSDKHIRGEWFNLNSQDVEYIKSLAVTS